MGGVKTAAPVSRGAEELTAGRDALSSQAMTPEAHEYLARRCKIMRRLIKTHGPCMLVPETGRSPFESLVRAVAHQQLNGTAAETILRRFRALFQIGRAHV